MCIYSSNGANICFAIEDTKLFPRIRWFRFGLRSGMVFTFFLLRCSGRDGGGSSSYIIPIHMSHWMITPSFQTWSWDHLLRDMARISGKDDLICSASAWAWMSVPFWFGWRSTLDEPTLASMQALLPFDEMPVVSAKDSDSPASPPSALFTLFVRQKFRWRFNEAVASLLLYRLRFLCSSLSSGGGRPHACTDTSTNIQSKDGSASNAPTAFHPSPHILGVTQRDPTTLSRPYST